LATRGVEDLVERQVRRWSLEKRASGARPQPCVVLSRLPASGASELGRRVAERLGYEFYGIEIVDQIAREQGVSRRLVEGLDEHVRSGIERFVADSFRNTAFTESDYLRHVVRTVATLAERGGAVILGRGSPNILRPEQALRVLLVAPFEVRVARVQRERELTQHEARELLEHEDEERRAFLRRNFGVEPDDPTLYDLSLNTGTLPLEAASDVVVHALRLRFGHVSPTEARA
jgi:cytidylate kinase